MIYMFVEKGQMEVYRKLDLLVHELQRYGVSIAGVQESKWFGVDVWTAADGYIFLHSGRPLPFPAVSCFRSADSYEHMVSEEGHSLRDLDASCDQAISYDRLGCNEGLSEGIL